MATTLEIDTIPCENCNEQINVDQWSWHIKHCIRDEISSTNNLDQNGSINDAIPCEFCGDQINIDDWQSHSEQCANTNHSIQQRNSARGIEGESATECIPCEYCGTQVSLENWIPHSNQCQEAERQRILSINKWNESQPGANLIPCDLCGQSIAFHDFAAHEIECRQRQAPAGFTPNARYEQVFGGLFPLPRHWDPSSLDNLSRYILLPDSDEYIFVADNFHKTLPSNQIVQIERIQNRRWYRQYDAHRDDFIERYNQSTEKWLFHGCKSKSINAIINDCFNRSHAVRYAAGQGIYFATDASMSLSYTQPNEENLRHMFMARVLVGKTTAGNQTTRVCPPGFDTTGGGNVFVTYHDAQAYGEYLITFR